MHLDTAQTKRQWLEPTLRRLHRKEKIALSALADTMDKAEKWWRMQAVQADARCFEAPSSALQGVPIPAR
jgi:hypothetical protein